MRILAFLLLIGLASATFRETVERASNKLADNLVADLEKSPSVCLWLTDVDTSDEGEKTKEEVEKKLREILDNLIAKIKDAIEHGKKLQQDLFNKIKEIREKMKDLNIDASEKTKEVFQKLKEHIKDYFQKLFERLGKTKRADKEPSIRELLKKLRDRLKESIDTEVLKQYIIDLFGEGTQVVHELLKALKEKGKNKLRILLDFLLDDDEDDERESRSLKDMWEKVKDYFKDLKIDIQEKYMKFGEWVKENYNKGMEHSKDKFDNIRAIAKEFLKHTKGVSKEVAGEAREFLKQYKEELGNLWDEVKEAVKEILDRKE